MAENKPIFESYVSPEIKAELQKDSVTGQILITTSAPSGSITIDNTNPKDLSFGVKEPISLVPPEFIRQVSRCMEDGAKKRSSYNWRDSKVSAMQLSDKVLRHVLDFIDGKDITDDSKLSNLASAAADLAVMIDAIKHDCLIDDRPKSK